MKTAINVFFAVMLMVLSSCTGGASAEAKSPASNTDSKVEVLYLHGKYRCATCKAVGQYSKELVQQLNNNAVVWKEVDLSTKEGEKIGDKYEVSGSGLVIVKGDKFQNLTEMAFRYAMSDTPKFKNDLKVAIVKLQK